jgi:hypothetical protein
MDVAAVCRLPLSLFCRQKFLNRDRSVGKIAIVVFHFLEDFRGAGRGFSLIRLQTAPFRPE